MSTKLKIQKVRAEVEAHEDRGWLKGYEEGLATREQQIVDAQAALEVRNEKIRELTRKKKSPETAREALELAWNLAHPVKEGQTIPTGTEYLLRHGLGYNLEVAYGARRIDSIYAESIRTLEPLPDPEPDWLDAPAVLAMDRWDDLGREKVWVQVDGDSYKGEDGEIRAWSALTTTLDQYGRTR